MNKKWNTNNVLEIMGAVGYTINSNFVYSGYLAKFSITRLSILL